jgi:hypothetical protein
MNNNKKYIRLEGGWGFSMQYENDRGTTRTVYSTKLYHLSQGFPHDMVSTYQSPSH